MIRQSEQRLKGTRKGESSHLLCDTLFAAELAPVVRGSSRRIHDYVGKAIAESTNIRVINRRRKLLRSLLDLPYQGENESTE